MLISMNEYTFNDSSTSSYTIVRFAKWSDVIRQLELCDKSVAAYRVQVIRKATIWHVIIGRVFDPQLT